MNVPKAVAVVVDDEVAVTDVVGAYLARDGFEVVVAHDGLTALEAVRSREPEVVVLDLGLPGMDGVELCRTIRTFSDCYVVMLTARVEEVDTLLGLGVGADDYMTKPFSPRELAARIAAMRRRPRAATGVQPVQSRASEIVVGHMRIDIEAREVWVDGSLVDLTRTEFDLLVTLAREPARVHTRQQLIRSVWGPAWVGDEHLVDVHILHVRQKLGDSAAEQVYIRTVRGVGYKMGVGQ